MLTEQQLSQYFDRIQINRLLSKDIESLTYLHRQHLYHIPYENLDLMNQVPLSLNRSDLFEKIILRKRGGYCFELQGLFCELLQTMGFHVRQYAARFMDMPGHIQMRRHRILVVQIDSKRYVCDIGVRSESPRIPLELCEGTIQTDGISQYRYQWDAFYGWVLWQKEPGKGWKHILGFTEEPQIDVDYEMPSFYCEQHPDSTFNKYMKISIFDENSNYALVGNTYTVYRGGKVVQRFVVENEAQAKKLLADVFQIAVPESYRVF